MPGLYEEEADEAPSPEAPEKESPEEPKNEGKSFTGNIEAFPDCQPGDVYRVRAVRVHQDEVEFENEGKDKGGEDEHPPEPEPSGGGEEQPGMMD